MAYMFRYWVRSTRKVYTVRPDVKLYAIRLWEYSLYNRYSIRRVSFGVSVAVAVILSSLSNRVSRVVFFELLVGFIGLMVFFVVVLLVLKLATSIYQDVKPQHQQEHTNNLRSINGGD